MVNPETPKNKRNKKQPKQEVYKSKYNIDAILKDVEFKYKIDKNGNCKKATLENRLKEINYILINTIIVQQSLIELLIVKSCLNPEELTMLIRKNHMLLDKINEQFGGANGGPKQ